MKCAVIIPVGPEHEALALDASVSVSKAAAASRGPFDDVAVVRVDDNRGEISRSAAGGFCIDLQVRAAAMRSHAWQKTLLAGR